MKKFLLGALLACGVVAQAQTYVATSFVGYDLGDDYTFASGESWSQDDEEAWEVNLTADGDNYVIANLLGWDETVNGVFNAETGCITIAGATEVQEGYCICGGFSGALTAQEIMDLCDQYGSYVPAWTPKDVVLKFDENGNIVAQTPIFIYNADDSFEGYMGYAYEVVDGLELTPKATEGIAGTWHSDAFTDHALGDNYTFASGETYNLDNTEAWNVTIEAEGDALTITNLFDWEETIEATLYGEYVNIPGGTELSDGYVICGGLGDYTKTAEAIMDTCDQYGSYVPDWARHDVVFLLEDGKLVAQTPILIFYQDLTYSGYCGYAYEVYSELVLAPGEASGISSIAEDSNVPAVYYNLQGVRVDNPARGIYIHVQGNKATKVAIR